MGLLLFVIVAVIGMVWGVRAAMGRSPELARPSLARAAARASPPDPAEGPWVAGTRGVFVIEDADVLRSSGVRVELLGDTGQALVEFPKEGIMLGGGRSIRELFTAPDGRRFLAEPVDPEDLDGGVRLAGGRVR